VEDWRKLKNQTAGRPLSSASAAASAAASASAAAPSSGGAAGPDRATFGASDGAGGELPSPDGEDAAARAALAAAEAAAHASLGARPPSFNAWLDTFADPTGEVRACACRCGAVHRGSTARGSPPPRADTPTT